MIRFTRGVIGVFKGNVQDVEYINEVMTQRRFLKDPKFWTFIALSNILPVGYMYFFQTKAGN